MAAAAQLRAQELAGRMLLAGSTEFRARAVEQPVPPEAKEETDG